MKRIFVVISILITNQSYCQNWVQDILDTYNDSLQSYGIVALVDNGKNIDTASIGVSFNKHFISTKNRFCIGSCTKMYTATLILKLHELGLLDINDSIFHYIPQHELIDSAITIKQLLNHTSGLTDFTKNGFVNEPLRKPFADYSDDLILSRLDTIEFTKGTRYEYCNTNYFLLRKIIEVSTDKPYESVFEDLIIKPLELKNTFPYYSNQINQLAHPIIDHKDLHYLPKFGLNSISMGIGNIVSDPYDVNRFIRALLIDKSILHPETIKLMTDLYEGKVGLGLFAETFGERAVLGHTGRQISYITYSFVDIKTGYSFVIMNNNANDIYIDQIIEEICEK